MRLARHRAGVPAAFLGRLLLALLVAIAPIGAALHATAHASAQSAARAADDGTRTAKLESHKHGSGAQTCPICLAFAAGAGGLPGSPLVVAIDASDEAPCAAVATEASVAPFRAYASRAPPVVAVV